MRIEALARRVSHEILDVADEERLDVASAVVAVESRGGPGLHRIGLRNCRPTGTPMSLFALYNVLNAWRTLKLG